MEKPLISVIIQVYDVQDYLGVCLNSVLSQTYQKIEIIIVDDGSTDSSGQIADTYALQDERIRVVHKKNGGLSDARNIGIEISKGEYLAFIDSDDYVDRRFIEKLYGALQNEHADIAVCSVYEVYENDRKDICTKIKGNLSYSNMDALKTLFTQPLAVGSNTTWNKLYRATLFLDNDIRFPIGKIHEDNFTTYKLFYYATKITCLTKPLYYYVQRSGSIMHKRGDSRRINHKVEYLKETKRWVRQKGIEAELVNELSCYELSTMVAILDEIILNRSKKIKVWYTSTDWIRSNSKDLFVNPCMTRNSKINVIALKIGWPIFVLLRKTAKSIKGKL